MIGDVLSEVVPADRARLANSDALAPDHPARAWGLREVDVTAAWQRAGQLGSSVDRRIGFLAEVIGAVCQALHEVPLVNATWADDGILLHKAIHVGVELYTGSGRVVPVIEDADTRSTLELAERLAELESQAGRRLGAVAGGTAGTFTIGDAGRYGAVASRPLLFGSQAGILHICRPRKLPRAMDDRIVVRQVANFCFSFDHRVMDGATSARFQTAVKTRVESDSIPTATL